MEKVIRKVSFEEAGRLDLEFWLTKTPQEKWAILTQMRKEFFGAHLKIEKVIRRIRK